MSSIDDGDIQRILVDLMGSRPYSHDQEVDATTAAIVTVERDLRFFTATMRAVFAQKVLPCAIVVVDCGERFSEPMQSSFEVIPAPSGPVSRVPVSKSVSVQVVDGSHSRSFYDAVAQGTKTAQLPPLVRALWLLHDDSRPADDRCLEALLETWRNAPRTALLGAKQLDWDAQALHDVGAYAGNHRIETLVVDGEPDQEQYDGRRDVYKVSLAGALVPLQTLEALGGVNPWFGTYGEASDFSRRICLSGARVVAVPQARIAHRRARFEGIRAEDGEPLDEYRPVNTAMERMRAEQRFWYTDTHRAWWPAYWLLSLIWVVGSAVGYLFAKRPYEAWCVLRLPWYALISLPKALKTRNAISKSNTVPLNRLPGLVADRQQVAQWHERRRAFESQKHTIVLSPLAKAHLHRRALRRFSLAAAMAVVAFAAVALCNRDVFRMAFSGGSLFSSQLIPTGATFAQLAGSASTPWVYGVSTGIAAPPAPWLLVWLAVSVLTLGNTAVALSVMFFFAAPLSAVSFWALAGVFTRSDGVRVVSGLLWAALGVAMGLYAHANLAMLTVMVFLPAAFSFIFRAVGLYHTEDLEHPHSSVQSAACAALAFIPVVAAEPQILLPLLVIFVVFLLVIPRHRAMLLLIPLPSGFVVAPSVINAVKYANQGLWRQLFGDITVPSTQVNAGPASLNFADVVARTFSLGSSMDSSTLASARWMVLACIIAFAVLVVLALVSLFLPFALRMSRMMWVVVVCGMVLSMVSARVVIAVDAQGQISGSVLPGIALSIMALLCCVCQVAGGAVARYRPFAGSPQVSAAAPSQGVYAKAMAVRVGRLALGIVLCACASAWFALGSTQSGSDVSISTSGLPMVAVDYLNSNPNRRILAVQTQSDHTISFTVVHTAKGDLIDSSPAIRVQRACGIKDVNAEQLATATSQLLANANSDAIKSISDLGFGGLYVSADSSAKTTVADSASGNELSELYSQLSTNIAASDGVQSVVSNTSGSYYRLTLADPNTQGVDAVRQHGMERSIWRYAWGWSAGILTVLYCLVALPKAGRQTRKEMKG